jgi:hypothetical protein
MADGPAWEDLRLCSPDPRPALGAAYRRVTPVEPRTPAVPPSAPAPLRLPIAGIRWGPSRADPSRAHPGPAFAARLSGCRPAGAGATSALAGGCRLSMRSRGGLG